MAACYQWSKSWSIQLPSGSPYPQAPTCLLLPWVASSLSKPNSPPTLDARICHRVLCFYELIIRAVEETVRTIPRCALSQPIKSHSTAQLPRRRHCRLTSLSSVGAANSFSLGRQVHILHQIICTRHHSEPRITIYLSPVPAPAVSDHASPGTASDFAVLDSSLRCQDWSLILVILHPARLLGTSCGSERPQMSVGSLGFFNSG